MKRFLLFFAILLTLTSWMIHTETQAAQDLIVDVTGVPFTWQNSPYDIELRFKRGGEVVPVRNIVAAANANQIPISGDATIDLADKEFWNSTEAYYAWHRLTITPRQGSKPELGYKGEITLELPAGTIVDSLANTNVAANLSLGFIDTRAPLVRVQKFLWSKEIFRTPFDVAISLFHDEDESPELDVKDIAVIGKGTFELELTKFKNAREFDAETGLDPHPGSIPSMLRAKYYKVRVTPEKGSLTTQEHVIITVRRGAVRDPAGNRNPRADLLVTVAPADVKNERGEVVEPGEPVTPEQREALKETETTLVPDENLRQALRNSLNLGTRKYLTSARLAEVTTLQLASSGITDLTGLAHAKKLTTLDLRGNIIKHITPLQGLTALTTLDLGNNEVEDITPLQGLTALTTLDLSGNRIGAITPLQGLSALTALDLSNNPIDGSSLASLKQLTGLQQLEFRSIFIPDVSFFALNGLTSLDLSNNSISNLQPLSGLTELQRLILAKNAITDVRPLDKLKKLRVLNLSDNQLSDIRALAWLTSLTHLHLKRNHIDNVEPIAGLRNLLKVNLEGNDIFDTSPLWHLTRLAPPADIDIRVAQYSPWDVHPDGKVNWDDCFLVIAAFGFKAEVAGRRKDVNRDGIIDHADFDEILDHLDDPSERDSIIWRMENTIVRGAPSALATSGLLDPEILNTLDYAVLKAELDRLLAASDGSLKYLRAIQFLQNVLALLTPEETLLLANYPNPFNPETWIPYQLAKESDVEIFIYDAQGILVRHLALGHQRAGYYTEKSRAAYWDGRNSAGERVATGIYFYRLQADNASLLRKMLILK